MSEETDVLSESEVEEFSELQRQQRNFMLADSDWTQLSDVNQQTRDSYVGYRQALRDLPDHPNWPQLTANDWPVKPE
jgi:hypothetical protein